MQIAMQIRALIFDNLLQTITTYIITNGIIKNSFLLTSSNKGFIGTPWMLSLNSIMSNSLFKFVLTMSNMPVISHITFSCSNPNFTIPTKHALVGWYISVFKLNMYNCQAQP